MTTFPLYQRGRQGMNDFPLRDRGFLIEGSSGKVMVVTR